MQNVFQPMRLETQGFTSALVDVDDVQLAIAEAGGAQRRCRTPVHSF
eukprot:CAMPEP_0197572930 /NCGR_PEP_ID=MMETSP1320-20131121/42711_1 /TAXON_ID=91990 /ORGANISM="Bolidomonas sp., Strain RCC2347" /LENGTH=46 /DNA_ID= /DNA_START= /DNA_END= /DNA_ORIENTATION=